MSRISLHLNLGSLGACPWGFHRWKCKEWVMFEFLVFLQKKGTFQNQLREIGCLGIIGIRFLNVYPWFGTFGIPYGKNVRPWISVWLHSLKTSLIWSTNYDLNFTSLYYPMALFSSLLWGARFSCIVSLYCFIFLMIYLVYSSSN